MVLTLLAVAALIILTGAENTFLIAIVALLVYLYPAQSILYSSSGITQVAGRSIQTKAYKLLPQQEKEQMTVHNQLIH